MEDIDLISMITDAYYILGKDQRLAEYNYWDSDMLYISEYGHIESEGFIITNKGILFVTMHEIAEKIRKDWGKLKPILEPIKDKLDYNIP